LNSYRDLKNSLDYAREEGKIEGLAEGEQERLKLNQSLAEKDKLLEEQQKEIEELKRLYGTKF
jgi:hypothetical protein